MITFAMQHQFWAGVILYWIFSAAVSAMPEAKPDGAPGYLWLFRFLHSVAGNITTVFGGKIPGLKTLALILLIPLTFSSSACAAFKYTVHPGALNPSDSITYDTLRIAETAIDSARAAYQAGGLPDSTKPGFNALVKSYTVARESWLTYRGAVAAERKRDSAQPQLNGVPSTDYFNQLNKNLIDLGNALRAFEEDQ
jgi:hypothetical protein